MYTVQCTSIAIKKQVPRWSTRAVMTPVKTHLPLSPMSNISPPMSNILRCPRVLWNITAMGGTGFFFTLICSWKVFWQFSFSLGGYWWKLWLTIIGANSETYLGSSLLQQTGKYWLVDKWTTNAGSWWKSYWCWWLAMMALGDDDDLWKVPW